MSATMARHGGRVQLEQSDMRLALNMAKMAKGGLLSTAIEETQFLIKNAWVEVRDGKMQRVEFPGDENVKAANETHPAMLRENQMDCCLPCHTGTAQYPHTRWRRKGAGAPTPEQLRQPTPEPTTQPPDAPLVPPGNNRVAHLSKIEGVPSGYMHIHTPLHSAEFFNQDAYAKHMKRDKDFDPDLLTDVGTSTG